MIQARTVYLTGAAAALTSGLAASFTAAAHSALAQADFYRYLDPSAAGPLVGLGSVLDDLGFFWILVAAVLLVGFGGCSIAYARRLSSATTLQHPDLFDRMNALVEAFASGVDASGAAPTTEPRRPIELTRGEAEAFRSAMTNDLTRMGRAPFYGIVFATLAGISGLIYAVAAR